MGKAVETREQSPLAEALDQIVAAVIESESSELREQFLELFQLTGEYQELLGQEFDQTERKEEEITTNSS